MTMFKLTPSETREAVIDYFECGLVPFIQASPALGKSSIIRSIAKEFGYELIDIRLSQCAPEDFMGLPMRVGEGKDMRAQFAPFNMFPLEGTELPEGKNGWILFFDEFNSAARSVEAAAYKVLLDHYVGQAKLHENCICVCAGNLSADRAITREMSTATQSRLVHIEMVHDHREFMNLIVELGFDSRILGFLEYKPSAGHKFSPDHTDRTFPAPRTWEFVSKYIKGKTTSQIKTSLLAGCIGDGTAVEFATFLQEYDNIPKYEHILSKGDTLAVPSSASTSYATVTMMLEKFSEDTFVKAMPYLKRFPPEFQVVYFRGVVARYPKMLRNADYTRNITHLVKFLNDTSDEVADAA